MSNMLGVALREARGPLNTLLERLAGRDGAVWLRRLNKFNRGENPFEVPRIIEVTSNGFSGDRWFGWLMGAQYNVDGRAIELLRSASFMATNGVRYRLAVIMGSEFEDGERTNATVWAEGERRGYLKPPAEAAPLLRELVSDEELEAMGLWGLIVMHEPITDSDGRPSLLGFDRGGRGRWLDACDGDSGRRWVRGFGFVFLVPQV